jgi:uncharacterized protein YdcH (DUF465 family)
MPTEHLDHALSEEFAGHAETIHRLKVSNPHFKDLMTQNHDIWTQIQNIHHEVTPADDSHLHNLQKQRLKLLDEIAALVRDAEA